MTATRLSHRHHITQFYPQNRFNNSTCHCLALPTRRYCHECNETVTPASRWVHPTDPQNCADWMAYVASMGTCIIRAWLGGIRC